MGRSAQEKWYPMRATFKTAGRWQAIVLAACLLLASAASGGTYKIVHNFGAGSDGQYPAGGLVMDGQGTLYGATTDGDSGCKGQGSGGTLFRLKASGGRWRESILYCFAGQYIDGFPYSGLIVDASGDLFGTAYAGPGGVGDVFELAPDAGAWDFSIIYAHHGGGCLVLDQVDDLFGCIPPGGIGELSRGANGWTYTDLSDQTTAESPLSWDVKGNLYGTDLSGGNQRCSGGCGTAFQLIPNGDGTWTYHVLHYFGGSKNDGILPVAGLAIDAAGNAYGVTWAGGKYNCGIAFKLEPSTGALWKETVLHEFLGEAGCGPVYTLALDSSGALYGMTQAGDKKCGPCGNIFKLAPQKSGQWKYSVLHTFHGTDGAGPFGVILDSKGNIFGTTYQGGKYGYGVVFEITP